MKEQAMNKKTTNLKTENEKVMKNKKVNTTENTNEAQPAIVEQASAVGNVAMSVVEGIFSQDLNNMVAFFGVEGMKKICDSLSHIRKVRNSHENSIIEVEDLLVTLLVGIEHLRESVLETCAKYVSADKDFELYLKHDMAIETLKAQGRFVLVKLGEYRSRSDADFSDICKDHICMRSMMSDPVHDLYRARQALQARTVKETDNGKGDEKKVAVNE